MDRIQRLFQTQAAGGGGAPEAPMVDTAEMVYISSMALLKMLKHGCALHSCESPRDDSPGPWLDESRT